MSGAEIILPIEAPALKMPIEDVFKNHKEPFEVKRLKHLIPFKAYQKRFFMEDYQD